MCQKAACNKLIGQIPKKVLAKERLACKEERSRRVQVVKPGDTRLKQDRFKSAVTIVANTDLKYEICKVRAAEYARQTKQRFTWSPARGTALADSLIHDPALRQKKIEWLQYHNKKCSALWRMLPLVVGSRVALVDHLDRSNTCLLRGRSGVVTGWVVDPREPDHDEAGDIWLKYPVQAVMVQFEGANWQLDGMPSPGTYPTHHLVHYKKGAKVLIIRKVLTENMYC